MMNVLVFAEVLQEIKLPAKVRKRGRPKGAERTVIGLPRKKKRGNKPVPFLKKCPVDKERGWFVFPTVCGAVIQLVYFITAVVRGACSIGCSTSWNNNRRRTNTDETGEGACILP